MKHNSYLLYLVCLIPVFIITACTSNETPVSMTEEPSGNPTAASFTTTLAPPSATMLPTVKPITSTPTPSPSRSPTPSGPTQTPDLLAFERYASESLSSDGRWAARSVSAYPINEQLGAFGEQAHILLKVVDLSTTEEWVLVDEWTGYGLGMATPNVIRWTDDGRYLFFADTGVPDGCGPAFVDNLRRANLLTKEIIPMPVNSAAVFPDGQKLLTIDDNGLVLLDLTTGQESYLPLEIPEGQVWPGQVDWSPDGNLILITFMIDQCSGINPTSTILLVNLQKQSVRPFIEKDGRNFRFLSWPEWRFALLQDLDGNIWWLDVDTGVLVSDPPLDYAQAQATLLDFFEALSSGEYAQAADLFNGDYDSIQQVNPVEDPQDKSALWQAACEINGFLCLPIGSAIPDSHPSPEKFIFRVTFLKDGDWYVRSPCCGADIADMPPQWQFTYTVTKDETGNYRVIELPVWVP